MSPLLTQAAFGTAAGALLLSALMVVTSANLVRSVLWLGVTLLITAGIYLGLAAPFMAGIQVLLYAGGVITLMLFGVMLTRRQEGTAIINEQKGRYAAFIGAATLFGAFAGAIYETDGLPTAAETTADGNSTQGIGYALLTEHLLAFELLSLLLLAAMIGAIVLARRRDHSEERPVRASLQKKRPPTIEEGA